MAEIPHFALPFRFVGSPPRVAVVEQDTEDDVVTCVEAIVRTRPGDLVADQDIGVTDPTFTTADDGTVDRILSEVEVWEPRATLLVTEGWDFEAFVRKIDINVRMEGNVG